MLLVCQNWGGFLGLTIPMVMADRLEALLVMNTTLTSGVGPLTKGFVGWRTWNSANPDMLAGKLMSRAMVSLIARATSKTRNNGLTDVL